MSNAIILPEDKEFLHSNAELAHIPGGIVGALRRRLTCDANALLQSTRESRAEDRALLTQAAMHRMVATTPFTTHDRASGARKEAFSFGLEFVNARNAFIENTDLNPAFDDDIAHAALVDKQLTIAAIDRRCKAAREYIESTGRK